LAHYCGVVNFFSYLKEVQSPGNAKLLAEGSEDKKLCQENY
jgi:hypothetical protein